MIFIINAKPDKETWTMSNWPAVYSEAKIEHDKLVSTHRSVLLPAYDLNGELIVPSPNLALAKQPLLAQLLG
jgi:hypothetical protein